ncbi:MAG: hypothetical protein QXO71_12540 [Candidatus Jordarchaeaceae archaeon]
MGKINTFDSRNIGHRVRGLLLWITARKTDVLIVILWSFLIALVIVKAYWFTYLEKPVLMEYKIFYSPTYSDWAPRLELIDYILIIFINVAAGFVVIDTEKIVIWWIISNLLAFAFSISWAFLFMWCTLGAGEIFSVVDVLKGASYIIHFAILNVFRMIFPMALLYSFIACLAGTVIGERFRH